MAYQEPQIIRCCICGCNIPINDDRTCFSCLSPKLDFTSGISRKVSIKNCPHCKRYDFGRWMYCEWESKELIVQLLKKVKGLQGLSIKDAFFLYSEEHSKRIIVIDN